MARKYHRNQITNKCITAALEAGWVVELERRHIAFISPDQSVPVIFAAATPSDHRAPKNLRARLRRAGLQIPH